MPWERMTMDEDDRMLWGRTFKKWDDFETNLKDLCKRTGNIETQLSTHLGNQEKKAVRKEKVFYIVIAAIGGSVGLFQVFF